MGEEEILQQIGFSPNEAKVYLALLNLGKAGARQLIQKTGLYSANVYEALEKLQSRGFAGSIEEGKKRFFQASSPMQLLSILRERQEQLQGVLPKLLAVHVRQVENQEATVLRGKEGYRALLEDILAERKDYYVLGGVGKSFQLLPVFMPKFMQERARQRIWRTLLFNEFARGSEQAKKRPYSRIRFLPPEMISPATIFIYGEKTAIGIIEEDNSFMLLVKNRRVAESFMAYFKALWEIAKE